MVTENLSTLKIHKLTQAQYDRELASGNIDETALYLTPNEIVPINEGGTGATTAEEARTNLGITPENIGALQMEVVTYTGTGVYGADNPCSVSFTKRPKFVFVLFEDNSFIPCNDSFMQAGESDIACKYGLMCNNLTEEFSDNGLGFSGAYSNASGQYVLFNNHARITTDNDKTNVEWYIEKGTATLELSQQLCSRLQFNLSGRAYAVVGLI